MRTYYYKAYDASGHKRTGTVEADNAHAADGLLRRDRLKPYFLHDFKKLKRELRRRKKRRKRIAIIGSTSIAGALAISALLGIYVGIERAPTAQELQSSGLIEAAPGLISARNPAYREHGKAIYSMWDEACPDGVSGVEVKKSLLVVYVTARIHSLSPEELEELASDTIRKHHEELGAQNPTLYVIDDIFTILEAHYFGFTKSIKLKRYE